MHDKHETAVTKLRFRWESRNAIGYTLIRVFDKAGNVIETHEHKGDFREAP
jgi:hypothetical protein